MLIPNKNPLDSPTFSYKLGCGVQLGQSGRKRRMGLQRCGSRSGLNGLAGTYAPGECSWDGSKWVGTAVVAATGICATSDTNYGPPCTPGLVSLRAHDIPLPAFGSGNLMGLLQEMINRGGSCPTDLLAGKPQAEINWLCMALGRLYAQWKASGCVDIHGGSGQFVIGGKTWTGDLLGPIAEFAATGHCSQDIFLNACPSSPTATPPALKQITDAYGTLTPGVQPAPGVTAQNFAPAPMLPPPPIQTPSGGGQPGGCPDGYTPDLRVVGPNVVCIPVTSAPPAPPTPPAGAAPKLPRAPCGYDPNGAPVYTDPASGLCLYPYQAPPAQTPDFIGTQFGVTGGGAAPSDTGLISTVSGAASDAAATAGSFLDNTLFSLGSTPIKVWEVGAAALGYWLFTRKKGR